MNYWRSFGVVVWVPIGTVNFAPNREALRDDEFTNNAMQSLKAEIEKVLVDYINQTIANAKSKADAFALHSNYVGMFGNMLRFADSYNNESFEGATELKHLRFKPGATRWQAEVKWSVSGDQVVSGTFVTGFPRSINSSSNLSSTDRRKLRELFKVDRVHIVSDDTLPEWFANAKVYSWEDVKAVKLGQAYTGGGVRQPYLVLQSHYFDEVEIDESHPIYYGIKREWVDNAGYLRSVFDENDQVVLVTANRVEKFKRLYPQAVTIQEGVGSKGKEFYANAPQSVKDAFSISGRSTLSSLDPSRIDDPDLKAQVELARIDISGYVSKWRIFGLPEGHVESLLTNYPLACYNRVIDHTYIYINAVYKEKTCGSH
jgi:hypothetical protein